MSSIAATARRATIDAARWARIRQSTGARLRILCLIVLTCASVPAAAAETAYVATPVGPAITVFNPKRDACDGHDVADVPLRAWRGADGTIHAFALHFENRRMSGKSLLALKVECPVVFRGSGDGDPKKFDDRSWIAATWTPDGKTIHALAHHEFQANEHKGRCRFTEYMKCWWNSVLNIRSEDGGRSFRKVEPLIAASTPFPQDVEQGRHRGFFNPSNIIAKDGAYYTLIGTTGWNAKPAAGGLPARADQPGGVCLFRSTSPTRGDWHAYDGKAFSAAFPDPDSRQKPALAACKPIAPFPAPVGGFVRHRPSGTLLAVFQAAAGSPDGNGGAYATSGFYLAASRDLVAWSAPTLVLATKTLYDSACGADFLRSYPVLIDENAETRNFEDIGDEALLFYSEMRTSGCDHTSDRTLMARRIRISTFLRE